MKKICTLFAACLAMSGVVVEGTLLTYEGFDYSSGANLAGQSGGSGWRTPSGGDWLPDGASGGGPAGTIASSGLNYSSAGYTSAQAAHLPVSGLALTAGRNHRYLAIDAGAVYDTAGFRDGGNRLGAADAGGVGSINNTLYGSFLLHSSDWSAARMIFELNDNGASPANDLRIAQDSAGSGFSLSNGDGNGLSTVSSTPTSSNTYMIVFRVDFSDQNNGDNLTFWLNPEAGISAPATGGISLTNTRNFTFNNIEMRAVNGNVVFDEFRMGTTWESVAAIPEPGTLALVGIALGSLVLFRRRK
jgi:hypothetical protein